LIPGRRARELLRERDPGFTWPDGGLTEGSRRWLIAYQLVAVLALAIVIATLAVPRAAHSRAGATHLGFGYPISFVKVDETVWNPPGYPETYRFDPWEDIARWNGRLFVDWALVTGVLWIPIWLLRRRSTSSQTSPNPG
jgi:hypothetical protein